MGQPIGLVARAPHIFLFPTFIKILAHSMLYTTLRRFLIHISQFYEKFERFFSSIPFLSLPLLSQGLLHHKYTPIDAYIHS